MPHGDAERLDAFRDAEDRPNAGGLAAALAGTGRSEQASHRGVVRVAEPARQEPATQFLDQDRAVLDASLARLRAFDLQCIESRDANNCQDYPKDVCCLFMSNSGRTIVDHGIGYEISLEDALTRVDKAASLGLVGQALFVEVEQFIWGFSNATMENFIEMCFCCPCCCVAFNLSRNASRMVKRRFHPSGWTSLVSPEACTGCGECLQPCPQSAITLVDGGKAFVNQEYCVGCGICKMHCPSNAIHIQQTRPMLSSVQEYFLVDDRLALKIED